MSRITLERANSFCKVGRLCKDPSDTGITESYVAIKDIPRARADDFVDLTKSSEVGFTDMLQNLSQDIDWDRRHGGSEIAGHLPRSPMPLSLPHLTHQAYQNSIRALTIAISGTEQVDRLDRLIDRASSLAPSLDLSSVLFMTGSQISLPNKIGVYPRRQFSTNLQLRLNRSYSSGTLLMVL